MKQSSRLPSHSPPFASICVLMCHYSSRISVVVSGRNVSGLGFSGLSTTRLFVCISFNLYISLSMWVYLQKKCICVAEKRGKKSCPSSRLMKTKMEGEERRLNQRNFRRKTEKENLIKLTERAKKERRFSLRWNEKQINREENSRKQS